MKDMSACCPLLAILEANAASVLLRLVVLNDGAEAKAVKLRRVLHHRQWADDGHTSTAAQC